MRHEDPLPVRRSGLATKRDGLGAMPYTLCVFFDRPGEVGGGRECSSNAATREATFPTVVLRAGGGRWTSAEVIVVGDITYPSPGGASDSPESSGMTRERGAGSCELAACSYELDDADVLDRLLYEPCNDRGPCSTMSIVRPIWSISAESAVLEVCNDVADRP
ncbi:hypothetical protein GSI_02086 [Ganoderma sinense ZZ0214-1]|uniref:Uncharacterized protein n=1 Tax=Ganoderma sinense ZZ0214-1 TaxID=1077348 RepID=A0A2G8SNN0_9APHY|nr:hypothetical protein GSI_02086 [Ganoderma sinense ZZ0214-1]